MKVSYQRGQYYIAAQLQDNKAVSVINSPSLAEKVKIEKWLMY